MALPQLNANQVYALLKANGASDSEAVALTSVAVPESSFNPNAQNLKAPDYSLGLFQFNFRAGNFNASNPESSTRGGFSVTQLETDLNAQAQSALNLYRSVAATGANPTASTAAWYHPGLSMAPGLTAQAAVGSNWQAVFGTIGSALPGPITAPLPDTTTTTTTANPQTQTQATIGSGVGGGGSSGTGASGTGSSFGDSLLHLLITIGLVLAAIALLIGGVIFLTANKAEKTAVAVMPHGTSESEATEAAEAAA